MQVEKSDAGAGAVGKGRCRCSFRCRLQVVGGKGRFRCSCRLQVEKAGAGYRLQVAGRRCRWKREVQMQFQVEANCDGFVPGDPPLLFFSRNHQLFSLVLEAHR